MKLSKTYKAHSEAKKLELFEKDILRFLKKHKYVKFQETEPIVISQSMTDRVVIHIPTVNGGFELIKVKIIYEG